MKTAAEFVEKLVTIDFSEDDNSFGHYPFQLLVETFEGNFELNALLLTGDVLAVYKRVRWYIKQKAKSLHVSIDFPAGGDIEHDFVIVISVTNNVVSAFAIPYDSKTGTRFPEIQKSAMLSAIISQFKFFVFS